jgi:hypothetical protein
MRKVFLLVAALVFAFQVRVQADEGMWLLSLIAQVNMDEMTELGLQLTAEQIYSVNQASLKDAVGALDGGSCTAELVSPDGLLLTNHHCGYGEIQSHSSLENDYLKKRVLGHDQGSGAAQRRKNHLLSGEDGRGHRSDCP